MSEPIAAESAITQSEARYQRLLEMALEGILFLDAQGSITGANQQMARMLGYDSTEALTGHSFEIMLFPEDVVAARLRWEARQQGAESQTEIRLRRQDGSECWVLGHASIERDAAGLFQGTFNLFTDITERRRVERELAAKNQEIVTIFERVNDAFSAFDHEWRFTYLNHAAARILGRSQADLLGKCIWDEFEGARDTLVYQEYLRAVREQVTVAFEVYYGPLLGWFEVRAYPSPTGLSAYFRNINEEHRAQEERERLLAEQDRLLGELREATARQRRLLREMLFSISEGHLLLCDSESELPAPAPDFCPPVALLDRTIRRLRLDVDSAAETLGFAEERFQDLETAVGEAAMNAVRHARDGEGQVRHNAATGLIQVWIRDQGDGISEESLHRATLEKGFSTGGTLGHGFWLMLRTCDRIYLLTGPTGTTVVLEQERTVPEPEWLKEK